MSADRSPPPLCLGTPLVHITSQEYTIHCGTESEPWHVILKCAPFLYLVHFAHCAMIGFSQHHFYFSIIHLQSALHMRVRKVSRICIGSFPKFRQVIFWFSTYLLRIFMIFCPINLCYPANKQTNKQTAMKTVSPAKSGGSKYVTMPMINRETIC